MIALGMDVALAILMVIYWGTAVWLFCGWQEAWEDLSSTAQIALYFGALFWPLVPAGLMIDGQTSLAFGYFVLSVGLAVLVLRQLRDTAVFLDLLSRKRTIDERLILNTRETLKLAAH